MKAITVVIAAIAVNPVVGLSTFLAQLFLQTPLTQANTQEFWNACTAICDERDWRMGGSFFDGKGQPSQVSAVSHGSSTTRFNGINVINTARKIG